MEKGEKNRGQMWEEGRQCIETGTLRKRKGEQKEKKKSHSSHKYDTETKCRSPTASKYKNTEMVQILINQLLLFFFSSYNQNVNRIYNQSNL